MSHPRRPFLQFALLLAIGLRTVFGAPCCLPMVDTAEAEMAAHAHHAGHADHADHVNHGHEKSPADNHDGHSGHGDDPSANPCCSACGPTLPAEPTVFASQLMLREAPEPAPIRSLATRPPFPAYDATGPPLLI